MLASVLADLIDGHDARMIQFCRRLSLGVEPLHVVFAGQLPGQDHLQRHDPVQLHLPGLVNHAHPAAGDLLDQLVVAEEAGFDPGGGRRRGSTYAQRCPHRRRHLHGLRDGVGRARGQRGVSIRTRRRSAGYRSQRSKDRAHPIMLGKEGRQVVGQGWMAVQQLQPVRCGTLCLRLQVGRDHLVQPGIARSE